jgi:transcriptional regulator with XRE-family HTH domain
MKSLGKTLKEARENAQFSLRQVQEVADISTAYLSQLENEKIKKPSANILYKLAALYRVELDLLLEAAGIIQKASESNARNKLLHSIAFYAENLSDAERNQVLEYMRFLQFTQQRNA